MGTLVNVGNISAGKDTMSCVKTSPISYLLPDIQRVSFASEFPPSPFEELVKLPQGFPEFVDKPLAWKGHQFADETEYIYTLNTFEIGELECALGSFKGTCVFVSLCLSWYVALFLTHTQGWAWMGILYPQQTSNSPL